MPTDDRAPVVKLPARLPWLDAMRLLAALLVVAMHVRTATFQLYAALPDDQKTPWAQGFYLLTRIGNEAVILFFVLSGFLVGGPALIRMATRRFDAAAYVIDRSSRVFVPLLPALIWSAVVTWWAGQPPSVLEALCNLLSLQGVIADPFAGNRPLWSLSYEVWCYVGTLGVGLWWMASTAVAWRCLPILLCMVVFTRLAPVYLFCWLIGALAFVRQPRAAARIAVALGLALIVVGVAGVEAGYGSVSVDAGRLHRLQGWLPSQDASRLLLALGLAVTVQQAVLRPPRRRWTAWLDRVATLGARSSYSLYLCHFPLLLLLTHAGLTRADRFTMATAGHFVGACALCLLTGWVFYQLGERHTGACRRWLRARWVLRASNP